MGRRLLKFWSWARRDKKFFCEAGFLWLLSYLCVMALPFRHIENFLRAHCKECSRSSFDYADDVKLVDLSLSRVTRLLPWKRLCLSRSIAAFIMLRRRGIPAVVVAGVKVSEDSLLVAHAWVDTGEAVIGDRSENAAFTKLVKIGHQSLGC